MLSTKQNLYSSYLQWGTVNMYCRWQYSNSYCIQDHLSGRKVTSRIFMLCNTFRELFSLYSCNDV